MTGLLDKYRFLILAFLAIAAISGIVLLVNRGHEPVEVILASPKIQSIQGTIYVSGSVASPGLYPWAEGDTLADILQAVGLLEESDVDRVMVHVPVKGEYSQPQRVDLNTAEEWLLEALPGIGETRASAIVEYREMHGPFRSTIELTRVRGIGVATYEEIKDLITVVN